MLMKVKFLFYFRIIAPIICLNYRKAHRKMRIQTQIVDQMPYESIIRRQTQSITNHADHTIRWNIWKMTNRVSLCDRIIIRNGRAEPVHVMLTAKIRCTMKRMPRHCIAVRCANEMYDRAARHVICHQRDQQNQHVNSIDVEHCPSNR